ncbi:MAG TPA: hypothetical protein VFA21_06800 [Pyrinomonadaceae bacterium]|jgi:hypothetical protein|nr:hypothetical protein [Pyrinomonadaceae bacterium]
MPPDIPTDHPSWFAGERAYCCPHCDAPLGVTDGKRLTVGALIIEGPIKLTCLSCKRRYHWLPDGPK